MTKATRSIGNDEIILLERQYVQNLEVLAGRVQQTKFEFAVLITKQYFAAICAHQEKIAHPGMASVV